MKRVKIRKCAYYCYTRGTVLLVTYTYFTVSLDNPLLHSFTGSVNLLYQFGTIGEEIDPLVKNRRIVSHKEQTK